MKKRMLAIVAIMAVFGLAIAAVAYTRTAANTSPSMSCCKDSCPMKGKGGEHGKDHVNKDESCCCDNCPMKGEHAKKDEHGASCPMKKSPVDAVATESSSTENAKNCCGCACCNGKAKTDTAAL